MRGETIAASAGRAQETCLEQMRFPEVGRWAQYQALYNKKDPYTIQYAVVSGEKRAGKNLKRLEMLVPGSVAEIGMVEEIIMKPGEKPAMKMDGMMLNLIRGQMEKRSFLNDACKDVTLVGTERLTVPAGKFQAQHFRSTKYSSDTWLTADIPFAMVKSVGKNYEMTLTSHGDGASRPSPKYRKAWGANDRSSRRRIRQCCLPCCQTCRPGQPPRPLPDCGPATLHPATVYLRC